MLSRSRSSKVYRLQQGGGRAVQRKETTSTLGQTRLDSRMGPVHQGSIKSDAKADGIACNLNTAGV